MAAPQCGEHIKLLKRFFKWVSKSDQFDWKKPGDFDELSLAVPKTNREKSAPVTQRSQRVKTYTVEQLAILNQYTVSSFERFLLLCRARPAMPTSALRERHPVGDGPRTAGSSSTVPRFRSSDSS